MYGYQEFEAPFLERFELYAAKSGDEIVKEQSFVFEDRGGDMVVLRPELTPSLARMIASRGRELKKPVRWWSFGPFWRYEKPQRGRSREFFQWNIDLLGVVSPQADAEIVAIIASFFETLGLTPKQVRIKFNNRRFAESQLQSLGVSDELISDVFRLIDRRDKMDLDSWQAYAQKVGISNDQASSLLKMLDDESSWKDSEELSEFYEAACAHQIQDYIEFDPTVIRGLDYYTGTVFEASDADGTERSILGGGRYDNLVSEVGGDPISGVGYAMGDVVIKLVLEKYDLLPDLNPNPADILVTTFEDDLLEQTINLTSELRKFGFNVEWYPQGAKLNRQLKYADLQRIPFVAILGPEELETNSITIKNLALGSQDSVPRKDLPTFLKTLLE
jgi:histidyl-tRNA synthetase